MPNYQIQSPKGESYEVLVSSGEVLETPHQLDWAIGLPFSHLREWAERKGWKVIPVIERPERYVFQYDGSTYCVYLRHRHIDLVTKDGDEIKWVDLPGALKGLL